MAITTKDNVKSILNLATTSQDSWIETLIPLVEEDYVSIRNRPFERGTQLMLGFTSTGIVLPADEEITITIGNWSPAGAAGAGAPYPVIVRAGDSIVDVAVRIATRIAPHPLYEISVPEPASSTAATVIFRDRDQVLYPYQSISDLAVETSTEITTAIHLNQTLYPPGAEMTAAEMIGFRLRNPAGISGIASERLGDHAITYTDARQKYPSEITAGIRRFAKCR